MQFTERDEKYYATDRFARTWLLENGYKISDGLTAEEIRENDSLTTSLHLEIIREGKAKRLQEFQETVRKP